MRGDLIAFTILELLILLSFQKLVDGLGSASTLAVVYGQSGTICGIVAGDYTVRCHRGNHTFSVNPKVSFQEISGGRSFFCGLRRGGLSLLCWNDNSDFKPKRIYRSDDVALADLCVGDGQVCAREAETGFVRCWRLSRGSVYFSSLGFSTITCGSGFVGGVSKNDGRVFCRGNGIGDEIQSGFGNLSVSSLVAGESHACGLTLVGDLMCRGDNSSGQLNVPHSVSGGLGLALGGDFSCAIRTCDGKVTCWGDGGTGWSRGDMAGFESITAGSDFVCGLKRSGSTVVCWGPERDEVVPIGNVFRGSGDSCQHELPVAVPAQPKKRKKILFGFMIVGWVGLFFGFWCLVYCLWSRIFNRNTITSAADCELIEAERFSLSELAVATGNFSMENIIGSGSFGVVYRGSFTNSREVAVKRAHPRTTEFEFESELAVLSRLHRHENLVPLLGFCDEDDERILVYEYMPNGSLHHNLHVSNTSLVTWKTRIRIALEAAKGVEYLHSRAVIHRDIKPSNILLDSDMTAKLSDFGLSLAGPEKGSSSSTSSAAGTPGYMDPEYYVTNVLTAKSDVYGLGVVILELLTGKRAVFRIEESGGGGVRSVVEYVAEGVVLDERLGECVEGSDEARAVEVLVALGLRCVRLEGRRRPDVAEVVACLETAFCLCP